jgi:23S rRNA pseudouridine1911/1915/1917 synthase
MITPEELESWILCETPDLLVINKPGLVVCHPSKQGPWSSLVGACREYLGVDRLHMPSRLDRETSGVVVLAKNRESASRLQTAVERRRVRKMYWAILTGDLAERCIVSQSIARDEQAEFASKHHVVEEGGHPAVTEFEPLAWGGGYTFVRVVPRTGRTHQIRVHAAWLGHAIAGDKLYGPNPGLMLEFAKKGFTPEIDAALPLRRHALHAAELAFDAGSPDTGSPAEVLSAPLADDLTAFCLARMGVQLNSASLASR